MICKNCGMQNDDNAFICVSCGSRLEMNGNQAQNQNQGYNYGYAQNSEASQQPNENFSNQYNSQNGAQGFNQQPNGAYTYNYNQNYNYTPIDPSFVNKGSIIAALVVGILTQSWIAVILAVIALVRCSDFENAVRMGNFPLADEKRASINKLRKWAWILCIVGVVISIIGVILSVAGVIGFGIGEFLPEILDELDMYEDFDDYYGYGEMLIRSVSMWLK